MHQLPTRLARMVGAAVSVALLGSTLLVTPGAAAGVSLSRVLTGYSRPVLVAAPRGSSRTIYIVEQTGQIKVATWTGSAWHKVGTFLDIHDKVDYDGSERGLLGLALRLVLSLLRLRLLLPARLLLLLGLFPAQRTTD